MKCPTCGSDGYEPTTSLRSLGAAHLRLHNELAERFDFPGRWLRMNDSKWKALERRAQAEKLTLRDPEAFWKEMNRVAAMVQLDEGQREWWTMEIFLRVPQRGNIDHFERARDGAYKSEPSGEWANVTATVTKLNRGSGIS